MWGKKSIKKSRRIKSFFGDFKSEIVENEFSMYRINLVFFFFKYKEKRQVRKILRGNMIDLKVEIVDLM